MIMKTKKLRHLLTATAVLFSMMLALPRQAQAQNTVTIDGVKKNILSTEFLGGGWRCRRFRGVSLPLV